MEDCYEFCMGRGEGGGFSGVAAGYLWSDNRTTPRPAKFSIESLVIFVEKSNDSIDFPGERMLKIIPKIDENNC